MLNKIFIEQLKTGKKVVDFFYVEEKSTRKTRQGKTYLDLKLRDKTGSISAKVWDKAEKLSGLFSRNDYVKILALVENYQNNLQLRIEKIRKAEDDEIKQEDFLPVCDKDVDELFAQLLEYIESVENTHLKSLLDSFFKDEEFVMGYLRTPAAKSVHHTYLGGLLEHSLSMVQVCEFLVNHYGDLDRDLLITGAILHDIGKVRELEIKGGFSYTTGGELLGHTAIGMIMVHDKISGIEDFPEELALLIEHMILSHQGMPEWGAVKRPLFKEALILHYVDDIDAKINLLRTYTEGETSGPEDIWTEKCWYLDNRRFLRLNLFSNDKQETSNQKYNT
ncbi:MAG: HD domain-containing protein [Candidatus Eremiobacteraeota bacterium]|nr:HD domain-containing protein [Candidatus Eremiobacteraeota bacterium]